MVNMETKVMVIRVQLWTHMVLMQKEHRNNAFLHQSLCFYVFLQRPEEVQTNLCLM